MRFQTRIRPKIVFRNFASEDEFSHFSSQTGRSNDINIDIACIKKRTHLKKDEPAIFLRLTEIGYRISKGQSPSTKPYRR